MADARYALERDIFELILEDETRVEQVIPLLEKNINDRKELLSVNATVSELVKNDQEFHSILSHECGNLLLQIVYDYIVDSFKQYLMNTTSGQSTDDENQTIRDHTEILEALRHRSFSEAKIASKNSMNAWTRLMLKQ